MEDNKLKFKLKITRNNDEQVNYLQLYNLPEAASATNSKVNTDKQPFKPGFRPEPSSSGPNQGLYSCILCHKKFESEKGLFGHMRVHSGRHYQGIQAPGSGPGSGQGGVTVPEGWKMRGKRTKKGYVGFDGDVMAAAELLLHIANGGFGDNDGRERRVNAGQKNQKKSTLNQNYCSGLSTLNPDNSLPSTSYSNLNSSLSTCQSKKAIKRKRRGFVYDKNTSNKKRNKTTLMEKSTDLIVDEDEDDEEEMEVEEWKCSICNKTFPSHQALGGHKSSHKKHDKVKDGENNGDNQELQYKCKICDQSFASGQALGGHQRCHYNNGPSLSSSSGSSLQQISSQTAQSEITELEKEDFDDVKVE